MEPVKYLSDVACFWIFPDGGPAPRNRSASGYGNKIPCPYLVQVRGVGPYRRVYAICYANAASHYVLIRGERFFLKDYQFPERNELSREIPRGD